MSKLKKKIGSMASFHVRILQNQVASCGVHMDTTLGLLEENRFKKKNADTIKKLAKEVPFTYNEVESMALLYFKFQKDGGNIQAPMTRNQLREILHTGFDMTDSEINDIVVFVLDKNASQNISMEAWIRAMALFLRGTFEEKIQHCYNVYDAFGQGMIPRTQMFHLMRHSIHGEDESDDVIKDLLEVMLNKRDKDRDGKLTYNDFLQTVKEEPLMMEAFGQCLPSRLAAHAFRTTFTHYTGKYY